MTIPRKQLDAMPFGRWKSIPIEEVDADYLENVLDNRNFQERPDIEEMVENEFIRRKRIGSDADI